MSTDTFTVRAVVVLLGTFALVGLGGLIFLIDRGEADGVLLAIIAGPTGTALGALGTLLARTSVGSESEPAPVIVTNSIADPVNVEEAAPLVEEPEPVKAATRRRRGIE